MARKKKTETKQTKRPTCLPRRETSRRRQVETYEHRDKERLNNPPVGLVTPETDPDAGHKKKRYLYHPHLDLLPYCRWLQAQGITS